jgi:hypothetical protein
MPELWSMDALIVSHKSISGALAHWAVRQSPYTAPDNLGTAVEQFMEKWPHGDYAALSSGELALAIKETIEHCPLILAWNNPKIEGVVNPELGVAVTSRFDTIKPDYDFIDLGALARNVTHDLVLWAQVEAAQDETRLTLKTV